MRLVSVLAVLAAALSPTLAPAHDEALDKAIAGTHRSPNFVARDIYRHPAETLEFLGLKPTLTVVEIGPSGGYWTEILGPYLKDKGTYYTAIAPRTSSERAAAAADTWQKKLEGDKANYGNVKVSEFGAKAQNIAPDGTVDLVLTSRNVHNYVAMGFADAAFASFYRALKPGGILGVSDHRAAADKPQDPKVESGYVREDLVIQLAEKAGFKLVGKSEVLANPKDTKDYPKGVWTLPPTYVLGEQDRAKYTAIGEADNFLLKFQK